MAKLVSFGDSFTWGSDMADTMRVHQYQEKYAGTNVKYCSLYSRSTWQAHAAKYLGLDYKCLAQEGCSNQSIYRRFFESTPLFNSDDVISINFTWRDRYDFFNYETKKWATVRPSGTEEHSLFKTYYRDIQSPIWDQVESLKVINAIICYLDAKGLRYIVTCVDDLIYKDPKHSSLLIVRELQSLYKDKIVWFNNTGFHAWAINNGFPISEMWHPLEAAHLAAFEYLRDNGVLDSI